MNRLECVGETMRHALNSLATVAPDWLVAHSHPDWVERYGHRVEDYRLPKDKQDRTDYGGQIGRDGFSLLADVAAADAPAWLAQVPAVETLRRVWVQQYYCCEIAIQWRTETEGFPPAAQMINSPYDPEAHYAKKRTTTWVGYRVHLTESCDENLLHVITHVETTAAPTADGDTLPAIHQGLQQKDLLPDRHLVDTGYVDAHLLVESRTRYGVELYGPARPDSHRQASEAKGFAADQFTIHWEQQQAICPRGCLSKSWTNAEDAGTPTIKIKFSCADCTPLSQSPRLHPEQTRPAYHHVAPARRTRSAPARSPTSAGGRLCRAVWAASRDRRDTVTRSASVRFEEGALRGAAEDTFAAHSYRQRDQSGADRPMAERRVAGAYPAIPLCQAYATSCRLVEFASSIKPATEPANSHR